jgi:hypothetical protein
MADRHSPFAKHEVSAGERPILLGHITHDRSPPLLYHKRLAGVLDDRTVESGLALGDRRARLTAHYAPVA